MNPRTAPAYRVDRRPEAPAAVQRVGGARREIERRGSPRRDDGLDGVPARVEVDVGLDSIDSEAVALFTAELAAKKSGDKILLVLHQLLKAAFEWGLSPTMPTFVWPPKRKPKKKLFPPELFELLLAEAKANGADEFAFILLAGEMAMRSGELRGLCWERIDRRTGRRTIDRQIFEGQLKRPKGEKSRTFKPIPRTLVALEQIRHSRSEFVFRDDRAAPGRDATEELCSRLYRSVGVL
ncbi:hypothetical protein [Nannocystis punicea]|uniref:Tyr recombinase domain-containing protein n=1 Tax=Nannocystis punicea TaxID=2995304 RepID=A0ABY7GXA3_9BACT|nr:hypothetical protein [Nannocystis poenicansa]WAS91547.1 hypothetical protein O0S08_35640 [Nannocystis poenicansa]